jgi:hypothetical protein
MQVRLTELPRHLRINTGPMLELLPEVTGISLRSVNDMERSISHTVRNAALQMPACALGLKGGALSGLKGGALSNSTPMTQEPDHLSHRAGRQLR